MFKDDVTDKGEEEGKLEIFNILENIKNNKKFIKGPQSRGSEADLRQKDQR